MRAPASTGCGVLPSGGLWAAAVAQESATAIVATDRIKRQSRISANVQTDPPCGTVSLSLSRATFQ